MNKRTYSFTYVIGEEYTNGSDIVKISGFEDNYILIDDGFTPNIHVDLVEFISEWWSTEEE